MFSSFLILIKFDILKHALITFFVGYFLASYPIQFDVLYLGVLLLGFSSISGSAAILNHILEYRYDALMPRTWMRPIVQGKVSIKVACVLVCCLAIFGSCVLVSVSAYYTLLWSWVMFVFYNGVYTPLKRVTWLNTYVGSFPGALPPVCGWMAVGELSMGIFVLFSIFFVWQIPHFFALSWKYRKEYQQAGFKMLSVKDSTGKRSGVQMVLWTFILLVLVVYLKFVMVLTWIYGVGVVGVSIYFFYRSVRFLCQPIELNARLVFIASIIYQPIIVFLILLDRIRVNNL